MNSITIGITNLRINCIIGILPHERKEKQEISVNIEVKKEVLASSPNKINETIDYCLLADICNRVALKDCFLLETYGKEVLEAIFLETDAFYCKIKVEKEAAISKADAAFIVLERERV